MYSAVEVAVATVQQQHSIEIAVVLGGMVNIVSGEAECFADMGPHVAFVELDIVVLTDRAV